MEISKADFEQMKAKYDQEVKKGKSGKNKNKDIDNQTNWVSYTKEDLLEVLGQDGVIGIKFHFTEYTQKVAEEFYGDQADLYVGRLGIVYSPIYDSSDKDQSMDSSGPYYDRGQICPPACQ
ncbi:molecular chaperone DnaK [Algoriphagus litoralis]|uniref:molecular chaperone DnaK n=1 Tax=Algoriphagus litoralis TaxID=2202829 RepID=UPI000DBA643C|nr:molecular chaperone DnaK [Algoriphagus litoralis]